LPSYDFLTVIKKWIQKNKLLDDDDNNGTTHRESPSRAYLIGTEGVMDSKAISKLSSALHEALIDEEADSIQVPSEKRHHLSVL
jgi:hypothetical protein